MGGREEGGVGSGGVGCREGGVGWREEWGVGGGGVGVGREEGGVGGGGYGVRGNWPVGFPVGMKDCR